MDGCKKRFDCDNIFETANIVGVWHGVNLSKIFFLINLSLSNTKCLNTEINLDYNRTPSIQFLIPNQILILELVYLNVKLYKNGASNQESKDTSVLSILKKPPNRTIYRINIEIGKEISNSYLVIETIQAYLVILNYVVQFHNDPYTYT